MGGGGHLARTECGERREMYKVLVGNPEGNRLLGGPALRWYIVIKQI